MIVRLRDASFSILSFGGDRPATQKTTKLLSLFETVWTRTYTSQSPNRWRFAMNGQIERENDPLGAMTVREFCERYRLGHTLIYEMIKRGDLRAVKCGTRTLLLAKDVRAWERGLETMGDH
jgi:excisionase family DNA binding protein